MSLCTLSFLLPNLIVVCSCLLINSSLCLASLWKMLWCIRNFSSSLSSLGERPSGLLTPYSSISIWAMGSGCSTPSCILFSSQAARWASCKLGGFTPTDYVEIWLWSDTDASSILSSSLPLRFDSSYDSSSFSEMCSTNYARNWRTTSKTACRAWLIVIVCSLSVAALSP